jgi:hypothetical protein
MARVGAADRGAADEDEGVGRLAEPDVGNILDADVPGAVKDGARMRPWKHPSARDGIPDEVITDGTKCVLEPEVVEAADGVWKQVDAHAEGGVGRHALIDPAVDSGAFELQRQAEAADATIDHGHVHRQLTGT